MPSRSVKALSQGGDPPQGLIEGPCGKLHKIRDFRPYQRGANRLAWVQIHENRTIECKLADVIRRHFFISPWRFSIRLEIADQNRVLRERNAVYLA